MDQIKRLKTVRSDLKFDGKTPIMVFDFNYRFANEAQMLGMSEAQAFVALPYFLSVFALH